MGTLDSEDVSRWFDAHAGPMVVYAQQFVDRDEAQDVVQDVFVRLVRQAIAPRNIRAWLYRAVRNVALSRVQSRRRRWRRESCVAAAREEDWFDPRAGDQIDARAAQQHLKNLPEVEREIVVLRIWADLSLAQIAKIVGLSRATVFRRYQKALSELYQRLEFPCRKDLNN